MSICLRACVRACVRVLLRCALNAMDQWCVVVSRRFVLAFTQRLMHDHKS